MSKTETKSIKFTEHYERAPRVDIPLSVIMTIVNGVPQESICIHGPGPYDARFHISSKAIPALVRLLRTAESELLEVEAKCQGDAVQALTSIRARGLAK